MTIIYLTMLSPLSHAISVSLFSTCIYGAILNDIDIYSLSLLRGIVYKLRKMYYIPFIITFPFAYYYASRSRFKSLMQ